jgi:hypothetical protein
MDRTTSTRRTPQRIADSSAVFTWDPIWPSIPSYTSLEGNIKDCSRPTQHTAQADTDVRVIHQLERSLAPGSGTYVCRKALLQILLTSPADTYVRVNCQPRYGRLPGDGTFISAEEFLQALHQCLQHEESHLSQAWGAVLPPQPEYSRPPGSGTYVSGKALLHGLLTFPAKRYVRVIRQPKHSRPPGNGTFVNAEEVLQALRQDLRHKGLYPSQAGGAVLRPQPKRGRPLGSGTFASEEEFFNVLRPIFQGLRQKGTTRPTQEEVVQLFPVKTSVRQLQRWLEYFHLIWADILERT